MPVYFESAEQPSAQDLADLEKIYADAPAWLLTPYADAAALIEHGLASNSLVTARFNSRLLGAALLDKQPGTWTLSHLCVRALTRRVLEEATRLATEAQATLQVSIAQDQTELQQIAQNKSLAIVLTG